MPLTSPDQIFIPEVGMQVAPLQELFAGVSNSVQSALDKRAIKSYKPADFDALASITGMLDGDIAAVTEGRVEMRYQGNKWVQTNTAIFANTTARNTAYAKASGIFRTDSARTRLTDLGYTTVWLVDRWIGVGGLVPIKPASVEGVGVTVQADASVKFAGGGTGGVLKGVFSGNFDHYRILVKMSGTVTGAGLYARLAVGSNVNASGNYVYEGTVANALQGSTRWASGGNTFWDLARVFGGDNFRRAAVVIDLMDPYLTDGYATINWQATGIDANGVVSQVVGGQLNVPNTAFDGLHLFASSGELRGSVRVFGYGMA